MDWRWIDLWRLVAIDLVLDHPAQDFRLLLPAQLAELAIDLFLHHRRLGSPIEHQLANAERSDDEFAIGYRYSLSRRLTAQAYLVQELVAPACEVAKEVGEIAVRAE